MQNQYEKKNVWEKSKDAYSFSIRVQTTLNHIRLAFYHGIKDSERNICPSLSASATRTWKFTRCIMQSGLVWWDFPFKIVCKLVQHTEKILKKCREKSNNAYSLLRRVKTTIKRFRFVLSTISTSKKNCFFRARAEKGIAWHNAWSSLVCTWYAGGVGHDSQRVLGEFFARAHIWSPKGKHLRAWKVKWK